MTWFDVLSVEAAARIGTRMTVPVAITSTNLPTVDRNIFLWGDRRGIPQGSWCILGGASNVGKTTTALHLLKQAAASGQPAGIVSLDMKNDSAMARLHQGLVDDIAYADWIPSRWGADYELTLAEGLKKVRQHLQANGGGSIEMLEERDRALYRVLEHMTEGVEQGITFFIVDHLQKVRPPNVDNMLPAEVVCDAFDDFVDEHEVTVVGLSQLNRLASREVNRRPTMFDLHGGTSMESNSAIVLMLDHSRVEMDRDHHYIIRTFMLLEKNQMGPKNLSIPIEIDLSTLHIREARPDEEHLWRFDD